MKKFAKWLDSGGMGGMEATQGDRTDRQTGRQRRGEERQSCPLRGVRGGRRGGNEDIFQGETLQSRSLWKY